MPVLPIKFCAAVDRTMVYGLLYRSEGMLDLEWFNRSNLTVKNRPE